MNESEPIPLADIAVSLFAQGKYADEIWSALVSSGISPAAAKAHVESLIVAVSLLDQGKSAADVWSALVSHDLSPTAAEVLVKDLISVRRMQLEKQRQQEERVESGFCEKCYDKSTSLSPWRISITRNVFMSSGIGTTFYGGDSICTCGSAVRVLWVVFFYLPIFPLGTYRYRDMGSVESYVPDNQFVARPTLTIRMGRRVIKRNHFVARHAPTIPAQVATHYLVWPLILLALVAIIVIATSSRR